MPFIPFSPFTSNLTTTQYYTLLGTSLTLTTLLTPLALLLLITYTRTRTVPKQIPWTGLRSARILPRTRACLREFTAGRKPAHEGYKTYSKHGQPFVLPAFFYPEVALPASSIGWMAAQPEHVLSGGKPQSEMLALKYLCSTTLGGVGLGDFMVLRRDLTRSLSRVLPGVREEMEVACGEMVDGKVGDVEAGGKAVEKEEWKSVPIFKIISDTSRRLNNRLFVGSPLCRDPRYISRLQTWETAFGVGSAIIRQLMPEAFKPVLAPLVAMPVRFLMWRVRSLVMPLLAERLAKEAAQSDQKVSTDDPDDKPLDVLQWMIDAKLENRTSRPMTWNDVVDETVELNFFSVHTIAIGTSVTLLNILRYPSAQSLITALRAEADAILPTLSTNPRNIRHMTKLDSVIREALRVSSLGARGLSRQVVCPGGVTTPEGLYLPQGTRVCAIVSARQVDEDVWEKGEEFVPLRFWRGENAVEEESEGGGKKDDGKAKHAVHVTEDFLSFGLGRHACPGRFFAVQALKIIIGHLLTTYDFEPLTEDPKMLEIGEVRIPHEKATVKIRRRRDVDAE